MSFYIRKSLQAGPFRFNLSKSGIEVSTGFIGFRIGTGPRGNCVHIGHNRLYYRATPQSGDASGMPTAPSSASPLTQLPIPQGSAVEVKDIEHANVLQLQNGSSAELLSEMDSKYKKFQLQPIVMALSVIALIVLALLKVQAWVYAIAVPIELIAIFFARRRDQLAKTVILFYELESDAENAFQAFHNAFKELTECARAWYIASSGIVVDLSERKRQAGASSLVRRNTIRLNLQAPPYVSTNVAIPVIPVGKQTLYFFPDRLLIYESKKVGAVSYSDVELQFNAKRFIESDAVPRDAQIVDHTWQYVNKGGGPDKRFKNNRQLPIALYGEIYFKSSTGLNELIQLSKPNMGLALADALKKLAYVQQEQNVSTNYSL